MGATTIVVAGDLLVLDEMQNFQAKWVQALKALLKIQGVSG